MTAPLIRTPREWDAPCRSCRGSGTEHHKQQFALWTFDEYPHLDPEIVKLDLPSDVYICTARPGSTIFEACTEGVEISRLLGRPVVFMVNGSHVLARADSNPDELAKEWWPRCYGVTYEQSMANR